MTFLEFTFQSFWHFSGIVILMWMALAGIIDFTGTTTLGIIPDWIYQSGDY